VSQEKQFDPSARKLKKAREDGDVAKSRELTAVFQLGVGFTIIYMLLFELDLGRMLFELCLAGGAADGPEAVVEMVVSCLLIAGAWCVPVVLCALAATVGAEALQVGCKVAFRSLSPSFSKLNPAKGLKRMFGLDSDSGGVLQIVYDVGKNLLLLLFLLFVTLWIGFELAIKQLSDLERGVQFVWLMSSLSRFASVGLFSVALLAGIDLLYQRWKRRKRLRMDVQEMKRELKDSDGDPQLRGMRKQLYQEVLLHGMLEDVRKAKVIVVGETTPAEKGDSH